MLRDEAFSGDLIKEGLLTTSLGWEVRYYPSTGSTNRIAKELAMQGAREGTLVIADYQTHGRGRWERSWWSPPGKDLLFSLIFRPGGENIHPFHLTMVASLSVASAIRQETGLEALIKWPNDVYLKGKKVSGILSELGMRDEELQYIVVGIGINVNSDPGVVPELKNVATSLFIELGKTFPRMKLLRATLAWIEDYYRRLKEEGVSSVRMRWEALSLIIGKRVQLVSGGRVKEGIAEAIDDEGGLMLRDDSGEKQRVLSAEVTKVLC